MTEKDFRGLSLLLQEARIAATCGGNTMAFKETTARLSHLSLEGEWIDSPDFDEDGSYHEIASHQVSEREDDIYRVFLEIGAQDAHYATLKKLYDTRMEVSQDAISGYKQKMAALESTIRALEDRVRYLEGHQTFVADPDPFY